MGVFSGISAYIHARDALNPEKSLNYPKYRKNREQTVPNHPKNRPKPSQTVQGRGVGKQ